MSNNFWSFQSIWVSFDIEKETIIWTFLHSIFRFLQENFKMENIFTSAKPFLVVSKLFGFIPMTVNKNPRNSFVKTAWIDIVASCCCFALLCFFSFDTFLNHRLLSSSNSSFLLTAWDIIRKAELLSYFFLFLYQVHRRKRIEEFLTKIYEYDEKVRKIKSLRILKTSFFFCRQKHFSSFFATSCTKLSFSSRRCSWLLLFSRWLLQWL